MTNICISCYGRQQPIKPATEAGSIKYVNVKFASDQCDCLLFDSMLYVKVNTFPFMSDGFPGLNQYLALRIECLACTIGISCFYQMRRGVKTLPSGSDRVWRKPVNLATETS